MPTVSFHFVYWAILGIVDVSALSLRASPLAYNVSSNSVMTPSGVFPGYGNSLNSSKTSPTAISAYNSTFKNETLVTTAFSSSLCCFVVQDTIDVRYWADYVTYNTVFATHVTTFITFATQYIDTTVTTNISTVVRMFNYTSNAESVGAPTIPNPYNEVLGPLVTQIGLNGSLARTFGENIISPTQYYVFPSVKVISVPAIVDKDGRAACATTSTYQATCPAQTYASWNYNATRLDNYTESAATKSALYITGINSNAERYFDSGSKQEALDVIHVSFSKPFIYAPLSDQFPSKVLNENLGYVPQTLIEWMARNSDYVSKFPGIASCLPGGPSVDFFLYFCPLLNPAMGPIFLGLQFSEPHLTVSSTVTVAGEGCFHPGACPTPAAPGATAVAATPEVTPEAERPPKAGASSTAHGQDTSFAADPKNPSPPQAPSQPLPAPVETPSSTPVISPETQAVNPPPSLQPKVPSLSPPGEANQPLSMPTGSSENPLLNSPEDVHGANPPPANPAKPPSNFQGLGAIIAGAIGITSTSLPEIQGVQPYPMPTPTLIYSISIAASASAVVVNGVTSVLPAGGPEGLIVAGITSVAVGSQQISQNAASQYVVAGQTLIPGARPINVQGTEVSLAPSASAIVIAGSTIVLSSTSAPAFTVGGEVISANSASKYVVGGQTLTPGAPAVTISGTRISLAPSGTQVVVGSSTIGLGSTFTLPPALTVGSQTYTADSKSEYTIAGQILTPGGPAVTVSGTRLSLAPGATQLVLGSSTIDLTPANTPPPLTFGSRTFTANSASDYIIDGQTLIPGAPAITVSGTPISLAPTPSQAVIGSNTITLSPVLTPPPPLTFNSQTITANSASDYIIDNQTLIPGAPALTISHTPISLAPDASAVVIGGRTELLRPGPTLPPIIIGSRTFTADDAGAYVIGGQTVTPGASGVVVPGSLLVPAAASSSSVFTIAGQVFTAYPTAFSIDGTTISAGGPGVVVSGTPVRLRASGVLDIGNSTVRLSLASPSVEVGGSAFAGKADRGSLSLLYSMSALVLGLLIVVVF